MSIVLVHIASSPLRVVLMSIVLASIDVKLTCPGSLTTLKNALERQHDLLSQISTLVEQDEDAEMANELSRMREDLARAFEYGADISQFKSWMDLLKANQRKLSSKISRIDDIL
eukprot:758617-Hanusia_phi.AAC.1